MPTTLANYQQITNKMSDVNQQQPRIITNKMRFCEGILFMRDVNIWCPTTLARLALGARKKAPPDVHLSSPQKTRQPKNHQKAVGSPAGSMTYPRRSMTYPRRALVESVPCVEPVPGCPPTVPLRCGTALLYSRP